MSYTELHTGKLKILAEVSRDDLQNFISSKDLKTDYDALTDNFFILFDSEYNKKYVFDKGTLYEVIEWIEHDHTEYIDSTIKVDDEIHFTYMFYNGGTWEGEMLEDGLNSLKQ